MSSNSRRNNNATFDIKGALNAALYLQTYLKEEEKKNRLLEEKNEVPNNRTNASDDLQASYDKLKEDFQSLKVQKQQIEQQLEEKTNEINKLSQTVDKMKELEKINYNLREQAAKYQSALGATTNFRLGDNDKNNSVQLKDDILRLQDDLEFYITNLRPKIEIGLENINDLLARYKSKTRLTKSYDIPLIKAVLQRHVLETIFNFVRRYTEHVGNSDLSGKKCVPYALEAQIGFKTDELITLVNEFAKSREGDDNTTLAVPVKIRQQIYSALGNRGFSKIICERERERNIWEHNVIASFKTDLNREMERYRKILDPTKKEKVEDKAANIILDVIRIFYFRLQTQEPMVQLHWFQNKDKVDSNLMQGMWDDEESDDIEVDICKFPLMGIEVKDDLKRQIYTHAIIHHRKITNEVNEVNSEINLGVKPQVKEVKSEEVKPEVKPGVKPEVKSNKKNEKQEKPREHEKNSGFRGISGYLNNFNNKRKSK